MDMQLKLHLNWMMEARLVAHIPKIVNHSWLQICIEAEMTQSVNLYGNTIVYTSRFGVLTCTIDIPYYVYIYAFTQQVGVKSCAHPATNGWYIDKLYNLISVKSCTCCSYNTVRGKSEHIQQLQLAGHCAPEWVVTSIIVAICKGAFPPDTSSAGA